MMMMMMMMMTTTTTTTTTMTKNSENKFFRIHQAIRFLSDASRKT
jgi:hypothetical protein